MSDPVIPMFKRTLEYFEGKRQAIDAVITHLHQTIALLEEDPTLTVKAALPAHEPAARKVRKAKQEKSRPAVKAKAAQARKGSPAYTQEDVIAVALTVIRAHGPSTTGTISEAVRAKFSKAKVSVSTCLNQDAKKKKGAHLEKSADGLWKVISATKQGTLAHPPEEAERLLAQARKNAFNQPTSDIRA